MGWRRESFRLAAHPKCQHWKGGLSHRQLATGRGLHVCTSHGSQMVATAPWSRQARNLDPRILLRVGSPGVLSGCHSLASVLPTVQEEEEAAAEHICPTLKHRLVGFPERTPRELLMRHVPYDTFTTRGRESALQRGCENLQQWLLGC